MHFKFITGRSITQLTVASKNVTIELRHDDADLDDANGFGFVALSITTGGAVDAMSYPDMIHSLGYMSSPEFHVLQGMASTFLPSIIHPLKKPIMSALGGAFIHPSGVSPIATMDILKAPTSRDLAGALHAEFMAQEGGAVGGGLFSSLKNVFKKGISGIGKGAKAAVRIGKTLANVLTRGAEIAKVFQVPLGLVSPSAAALLGRGIEAAETVQRGIGLGIPIAESLAGE